MSDSSTGEPQPVRQRPDNGEQVVKAIRRIMHAVDRRSKKVARATGLTIPQIVVLRAIEDLGEVPTNRLSAEVDLTAATVITILDKLEEKGLVLRRRGTDDRRMVYASLTEQGRRIVDVAPPLLNEAFISAFTGMSADKRNELVAALTEVARLLEFTDRLAEPERPEALSR